MKSLLLIAASAASAALVTPTVAEARSANAEKVATERVFFGDLNLASEKGQARLDRRIQTALRRVCGDPADRIVRAGAQARACMVEGRARVDGQVQLALGQPGTSQVLLAAR